MNEMTPAAIQYDIMKGTFQPNIYLSNLCMAYFQDSSRYVAKSIFPICPVQLSTARFYTFTKEDLLRDNVRRKPQFGKVEPAQFGHTDQSYSVEVDQIIMGIDRIQALDYSRTNAPAVIDPRRAKVKIIAEQMNIHQDRIFAENYFKAGVWTNEWTGVASSPSSASKTFLKFSDDNCDPIALFDDLATSMEQNTGRRPNKLGLGKNTFNALKKNPTILERVKYGGSSANPARVNEQVMAELFGIEKVVVLSSIYNAAQVGQEDMNFICDPDAAILAYATNAPSIDEPSAGYIFTWDMLGNGQYMPTLQFEGEGGVHAEYIEGLFAADMKKTADDLAVFLKDCV